MNINSQLLVLFVVIVRKLSTLIQNALVADDLSEFILVTMAYKDSRMATLLE